MLGNPPVRRWVLVVSLDTRNLGERVDSVLIVPFESQRIDGPTLLRNRLPRPLSAARMRYVSLAIRRAFDPDSPPDAG